MCLQTMHITALMECGKSSKDKGKGHAQEYALFLCRKEMKMILMSFKKEREII